MAMLKLRAEIQNGTLREGDASNPILSPRRACFTLKLRAGPSVALLGSTFFGDDDDVDVFLWS